MEYEELKTHQKVEEIIEKVANATLEPEDLVRDLEPSNDPVTPEAYG